MSYKDNLTAEADSWAIEDEEKRNEKIMREVIRHNKLIKDLLLDQLPTYKYDILEVGGGPIPLSEKLQYKNRDVVDPCTNDYKKYWPCLDHQQDMIENKILPQDAYDLIICTNALDHVYNPRTALLNMEFICKPGGYIAIECNENNALVHPHPAHEHNLTSKWLHQQVDDKFETVWELNWQKDKYRYGHRIYEGIVGQPAFCCLLRKVVGYE